MALRLVDVTAEQGMLYPNSSIGFTGRAAISGRKPEYILEGLTERAFFENPNERLVFVDDGLARGAALMGRCMNSLGKTKKPNRWRPRRTVHYGQADKSRKIIRLRKKYGRRKHKKRKK